MDRQDHFCLPKLPQWLDWPGPKPLPLTALQLPIRQVSNPHHKGNQHVQNGVQGGTQGAQGSNSLQCFRCQGWDHMAREGATLAAPLNREGGPKGMQLNPLQQSAVSSKHSLCDPEPKLTQDKAVNQKGWKGITPILFLNPGPSSMIGRTC